MDPRHLFADARHSAYCAFCGAAPDSVDHCPSKVLLDPPYPDNLAVVPACTDCNGGFSLDEQYAACALDAVISGTADPLRVSREKVRRILETSPSLASRIAQALLPQPDSPPRWVLEFERISTVVLKLARGHAAYEFSEPQLSQPTSLWAEPLQSLSPGQLAAFESPIQSLSWPEIGSRAYLEAAMAVNVDSNTSTWCVIQPGRYRYIADASGPITVRIVLSEYLFCEVIW
jgi:hypothetical protein